MNLGLSHTFASSGPAVHIAPAGLFHIWHLTITNSILYGWIGTAIMVALFIWVAHTITVKPKGGIIQFIEVIAEFIGGTVETAFDEKDRAQKYVLYFVPLFFFILFNKQLGLIPGIGESLTYKGTALLRPLTADFNATLAMAVITMALVYTSSIREVGIKDYFNHFFVGSLKNPFYVFLGLIEMITDLTRVISLSLRLFLNISIVEIIVVVFAWLGHLIAPISAAPFYLLDLFDDVLQAFIFVLLGTMYLAIAVNHGSAHAKKDVLTEPVLPERMKANA
ncbi:MAG: F0F1 ATP synthase subunit A [Candidatus Saccharimonadales bacterium]